MLLYRVLYNTCSTQESTQLNKCDSGVVGNARPCQGRDRGFEPRLSLFIKRYPSWISLFHYKSVAEPLTRGAEQFINTTVLSGIVKLF